MAPCLLCSVSAPLPAGGVSGDSLLNIIEHRCTTMRDLRVIHAGLIKAGAVSKLALSRLMAFSASPGMDMNYAGDIFARVPQPNIFMWNTMIRGYSCSSAPDRAISLFVEMATSSEVSPQRQTYPSVFKACAELGLAGTGVQVHGMIIKSGLEDDAYIRNTIIHMYANCGFLGEARIMFDRSAEPNTVAWNVMIMGHAKCGEVDESRRIFDGMPGRNTITWNTMLSAYVRNGRFADALKLFDEMQMGGIRPSEFTMVSLLNAAARLGSLTQGRWIHEYLERNEFEFNPIILTALIDMYSRCGSIGEAYEIFLAAPEKGLSCWNSMILGLARNGHEHEAFRLFSQLETSGSVPDAVSFIGVFTACNHGGFIDEAIAYFNVMTEKYRIVPTVKHFSCIVDLMGRLGCIEEAAELIKAMNVDADAILWGSLLWASWKHGKNNVAERAADHVITLDSSDSSGYVIMSNIHAGTREFEEAIGERVSMKEKRVEKEPGCSSIEVDGEVHEFIASGGRMHRKAEEIYWVLNGMVPVLRELG